MLAAGVGALMSAAYSISNRKTDTSVRIKHTLWTRKPNMDDTNNRESKRRQAGGDTSKFPENLEQLQGYCLLTFVGLVWLVGFMYACVRTGTHVNINLFMCVHVW